MGRFVDYYSDGEVRSIMESIAEHCPKIFEGFDANGFHFITTKKRKASKTIKLRRVSYPMEPFVGKPYIVEVFDSKWKAMDQKRKNLSVFRVMCAIPNGGFDNQSKNYGKVIRPEIEMYMLEYAASGGVPNWMENPLAKDPLERSADDMAKDLPVIDAIPSEEGSSGEGKSLKMPVTPQVVASVPSKKKVASA
jgi:hypothetical protein